MREIAKRSRKGLTEAFAFLDVRKGLKAKARGRGQWIHQCNGAFQIP